MCIRDSPLLTWQYRPKTKKQMKSWWSNKYLASMSEGGGTKSIFIISHSLRFPLINMFYQTYNCFVTKILIVMMDSWNAWSAYMLHLHTTEGVSYCLLCYTRKCPTYCFVMVTPPPSASYFSTLPTLYCLVRFHLISLMTAAYCTVIEFSQSDGQVFT